MTDKQRISIIEVVQGFCSRTYGSAPCTAVLGTSGKRKCFNTEVTCQDPAHYDGNPIADPYLLLSGSLLNYAETPHRDSHNAVSNVIDLRVKAAATDWTPATLMYFVQKTSNTPGDAVYIWGLGLQAGSTGNLVFTWSADGIVNAGTVVSTAAPVVANGADLWVRVTFTGDNGAAGKTTKFFTSLDGLLWTQLGATVTTGGVSSIYKSAFAFGSVIVGGYDIEFVGKLYYMDFRATIDDPPIAVFDVPYNEAAYQADRFVTETASTGELWLLSFGFSPQGSLVSNALMLRFTNPQDGMLAQQYQNLIPSLQSLSITPAHINLAAMERNAGALGQREVVTAHFADHQHSDFLVDRYRDERIRGFAALLDSGSYTAGSIASLTLPATASELDDFYKTRTLVLGDGRFSTIISYDGVNRIASVSPRWMVNYLHWSILFSDVEWVTGNVLNPIITAPRDIRSPDGDYARIGKFVLNSNAGDRSFYQEAVDMPAVPGQDTLFYFWVYVPNSNSLTPWHAGMRAAGDLPTDLIDLNALPRDVWQRVIYEHDWSVDATGNVFAMFHKDEAGTIGDMIYVWEPSLEFNFGAGVGDFQPTASLSLKVPGFPANTYEIQDAYDPFDKGTFFSKWITRNPYYSNYPVVVREGLVGDAISVMRTRTYVLDRVEGPSDGTATLIAKDMFSKIEARKSVAPIANNGRCLAGITAAAGQVITLTPAGIGNLEYAASGFVVIGEEEAAFTRAADAMTLGTRGTSNTTAAAHNADDAVQQVLVYTAQLAKTIVYDLLSKYTEIDLSSLPLTEWTNAMAAVTELYSAHITAPTAVLDLVGELSEQAGFTVFPNVATGLIKMVPLRAAATSFVIDDALNMVSNSVSVKRKDSSRASQVWVYYAQRNPVKKLDEKTNFNARALTVSLAAETQYGTPAIREIFSRWIATGGRSLALATGTRVLEMFRDPPIEAKFRVLADDWVDRLTLAQFITPLADEIQDDIGERLATTQAVMSIERADDELEVITQQVTLSPASAVTERVIYVDNDALNLNMRTIHDSLYSAPVGTETVRFVISAGIYVGSSSTFYALRTGSWPAGVTLKFDNHGTLEGIAGAGGAGGRGDGKVNKGFPPTDGLPGGVGGEALLVEYAITIDNLDGRIWGGGGGGGGGGGSYVVGSGGGGGGAGAGYNTGLGGLGGLQTDPAFGYPYANSGANGTRTTAGAGGTVDGVHGSGAGGVGGGPGVNGTVGQTATNSYGFSPVHVGGAGGTRGNYVTGNALVTWTNVGDRRGGVL